MAYAELPEDLDDVAIGETCDLNNSVLEGLLDRIDDPMDEYMAEIAELLAEQFGLSEEQTNSLHERLAWQLVLLPSPNHPH
jgi:hypothetical protein